MIMPVLAMIKLSQSIDIVYVGGYFIFISVVTLISYQVDKKQAETGGWRVRESTLHLYEFIGGWSAAFCAQHLFRHKISKEEYQFTFWLIGGLQQYVAFDFILDWKLSQMLFYYFESMICA